MKKILKFSIYFLVIIFSQNVYSKPIPPGSGTGDIPANILILLDSSASMKEPIGGVNNSITDPRDVVELSDGNILIIQAREGIVKMLTSSGEKDDSFAEGNVNFMGNTNDGNCDGKDSSLAADSGSKLTSLDVSNKTIGYIGDEVIYAINDKLGFESPGTLAKVVAIDTSGKCIDVINNELGIPDLDKLQLRALAIKTIAGDDHLFINGRYNNTEPYFFTKNLSTGDAITCSLDNGTGGEDRVFKNYTSLTIDDGNFLYAAIGDIYKYKLKRNVNNYCPITIKSENHALTTRRTTYYQRYNDYSSTVDPCIHPDRHCKAWAIQIDPNDPSIIFILSKDKGKFLKREITDTNLVPVHGPKGSYGTTNTVSDGNVMFDAPLGLYVSSTKVWVSDQKPSVQEFNKEATISTWLANYGGKGRRIEGAINAIKALVSDTSFTSAANFGYGYWNSGTNNIPGSGHEAFGGRYCVGSSTRDNCDYYLGWDITNEQSQLCNVNSCLKVGVDSDGFSKIPEALANTSLAWGTDAKAFAELASKYYSDSAVNVIDPAAPCQLNYVIVISDGEWRNHGKALPLISGLRTNSDLGVRTLVVAYGEGIEDSTIDGKFADMAIAGSCDAEGDSDCEEVIVALSPADLKTQLASKVQQIIADRLSFTAPSITATIQEGGSLYQAQFNYVQHGEWEGTILRKTLNPDGTVNHDIDAPGNWNAAKKIKAQPSRRIWTVLPDKNYIGEWNNFNTENSSDINNLFTLTGNTVLNYHNATSKCGGSNEIEDDIEGLINFVRGKDYFGYGGCDKIDKLREHVLGDVYHSQLIEIGKPNGSTSFKGPNEEAYFRAIHNYQSFALGQSGRKNIIYFGANDGMLHAINAETGEEEWAFVPPFVAAKLPTIINVGLNGKVDGNGGSNAIFGVDGSPVVHDMFIKGLTVTGTLETNPSWHTILLAPYGRGGAGFSVLDITNTLVPGSEGPLHMYSVYNDSIKNFVNYADKDGKIYQYTYISSYYNIRESREASKADRNQNRAQQRDPADCDTAATCPEQVIVSAFCDTSLDFHQNGNMACYKGSTFTFDFVASSTDVNDYTVTETQASGGKVISRPASVQISGGKTKITFNSNKIYNASAFNSEVSSLISIKLADTLTSITKYDYKYDYSQLGETWSTPRVFRMPLNSEGESQEDKYVAVMGGGHDSSKLFIINLEDGTIAGSKENKGPISIIDIGDNEISNGLLNAPLVITPDTAPDIPWRGAMVYVNDLEGKITKINLSNSTENDAELYEKTTLFKLNSSKDNGRYSYFSMDATIGEDTNAFWLFGGTGNFLRINESEGPMDNILFGIKDYDYPYFKSEHKIPRQDFSGWETQAIENINIANHVDDAEVCNDTTLDEEGLLCPTSSERGWVVHLDDLTNNKYRKLTGTPSIFKGRVYFPIYKPPESSNKCSLGSAYICSEDDECGTNISSEIANAEGATIEDDESCYFVREGILSELVIFGDTLYGNVAGPSDTEETLVSIFGGTGDSGSKSRSWRQQSF